MADAGSLLLQSFRDKNFGLPIAEENILRRPQSRVAFVELKLFDSSTQKLTTRSMDDQILTMQAELNYPAGSGDTTIKAKAIEILDSYSFSAPINGVGATATVKSKRQRVGVPVSGWYRILVLITFSVLLDRT